MCLRKFLLILLIIIITVIIGLTIIVFYFILFYYVKTCSRRFDTNLQYSQWYESITLNRSVTKRITGHLSIARSKNTRGHNWQIKPKVFAPNDRRNRNCRLSRKDELLANRARPIWNALELNMTEIQSVVAFQNALDKFLAKMPHSPFLDLLIKF